MNGLAGDSYLITNAVWQQMAGRAADWQSQTQQTQTLTEADGSLDLEAHACVLIPPGQRVLVLTNSHMVAAEIDGRVVIGATELFMFKRRPEQ
jgi:hypothetical protein